MSDKENCWLCGGVAKYRINTVNLTTKSKSVGVYCLKCILLKFTQELRFEN